MVYCKKCILTSTTPQITINSKGICNICEGETISQSLTRYRNIMATIKQFEKYIDVKDDTYKALFMLSGGKDSIYMMYKLLQRNIKILPFTVDIPFESKNAISNINKCIGVLNTEHVFYKPELAGYFELMNYIFKKKDKVSFVKYPCFVCTSFIQIHSILFAYRMNIPYVVYCADPFQLMAFWSRIKEILKNTIDICGIDLLKQVYGKDFELLMELEEDKLPKFVYPYANMKDYNRDQIVDEITTLGLYETSPQETHCSLYSLLNYYSLKNFDTLYYAYEKATGIRSDKYNRDDLIHFIEKYKNVLVNIAVKDEISDTEKGYIKEALLLYQKIHNLNSESLLQHMYNDILSLKKTMAELKLNINDF